MLDIIGLCASFFMGYLWILAVAKDFKYDLFFMLALDIFLWPIGIIRGLMYFFGG